MSARRQLAGKMKEVPKHSEKEAECLNDESM